MFVIRDMYCCESITFSDNKFYINRFLSGSPLCEEIKILYNTKYFNFVVLWDDLIYILGLRHNNDYTLSPMLYGRPSDCTVLVKTPEDLDRYKLIRKLTGTFI